MSDPFAQSTVIPQSIPFTQIIGTAQFITDFLVQRNLKIIQITIDNQDPTNNITFRTEPSGTLKTIPPNSLGVVSDEQHDFIEVNPDAVTGDAIVTLQLATPGELRRLNLLT